ncbi:MAG: glutamine synthetase family protein [Thermoanaerobaculia bacterium]
MMLKKEDILKICKEENVQFMRLMFTDLLGIVKNVEIPKSQFEKALEGDILFDGSSIEGFTRIEESDMLLVPDLNTFGIFPWEHNGKKVGRLICDIYMPDGKPFEGCPRLCLKKMEEKAKQKGFKMVCGPEVEFFLFQRNEKGEPIPTTHDVGSYFDLTPVDLGERARREIVEASEGMGFEIEAAHHEVAPGQHEIDFKYADALTSADRVITLKFIIKRVALSHNLHASFMPKPVYGVNGSGMHTHQSLLDLEGNNTFFDPKGKYSLSEIALNYIGGILENVSSFVAITNPLVNSFKRLVPGYEAPVNVAWSEKNRSPLVRVPARRGMSTRCEVRVPDPSCNPYLAFAVMLAAGLDGIERKIDPGPPVNENIFEMSERKKRKYKIRQLPANLNEAIQKFKKSKLMKETLGEHIFNHFIMAKEEEWKSYIEIIHPWEHDQYLTNY